MLEPSPELHEAVDTRDRRFDGAFFVAIASTGIYCRPICPSRRARRENRRFFASAADAQDAGYRPCRRCRPEIAPGQATVDAVPRLAETVSRRIAAGALNGRNVSALAAELGLSERHLRRALRRERGLSPKAVADAHRLDTATRMLAETDDAIGRIAYASGFQSVRRFNAAFRERYQMPPRDWRKHTRPA